MKKRNKPKFESPQPFTPTMEEELAIMERLALCLSENKVLISHQNPGLEVRGKIKNN